MQKALIDAECLRKAAYPVGTIREWKGKKYIKTAPGKWRRKYDKEGKGAKLAIAALKKKVDACKTSEELLQLVLEHSDRFRDENGHPLPFVQELSEYVSKANDRLEGAKNAKANKGKPKAGGSSGGDDGGDGGDRTAKIFGHNYKEFKGKGKAAIEKLLETKNGFVEAAFHKEGIGDIDVVYGKVTNAKQHTGYGLAHILDKHPGITPEIIEKTIQSGKISNTFNGYNIETSRYIIGVNKGFKQNGELVTSNNWVVTSFKKKNPQETSAIAYAGNSTSGTVSPQNLSDNSNVSQNAGAVKQKTLNAAQIMQAGKKSERVRYEDIDWDSIEADGGNAKKAITKKNIFGKVDWDALKEGGMEGGAARLTKQLFDSVGSAPSQDTPEAMRDYVRGLNLLKDRLEGAKTIKDTLRAIEKIHDELSANEHNFSSRDIPGYSEKEAEVESLHKKWSDAVHSAIELEDSADKEREAVEGRIAERIKPFLVKNRVVMDGKVL